MKTDHLETNTQRIERLEAENARLAAALRFVVEECDWERGAGDERIGPVCWNALDGSSTALRDLLGKTVKLLQRLRNNGNLSPWWGKLDQELARLRAVMGVGK